MQGRHGKGDLTLVLLTLGELGDTPILVPSTLTSVTAGFSYLAAGQGNKSDSTPKTGIPGESDPVGVGTVRYSGQMNRGPLQGQAASLFLGS